MKKPSVTEASSVLTDEFSGARPPAFHVADDLGVEADAEVRAYLLLKDIAELYCTRPGDKIKTRPKTYLSSDDKWGPYQIAFLPYAEGDDPLVEGATPNETVTNIDPDVVAGVEVLIGDVSLHGVGEFDFASAKDTEFIFFRTVEAIVNTCNALLNNPDCPGSIHDRKALLNRIGDIVAAVTREKATDGFGYGGLGYQ